MRWRSFVAVGDSFTEGLDDPLPDGSGYRGWADLVALRMAAATPASPDGAGAGAGGSAEFRYANLAVRGRLFRAIVDAQVPAALAMRPDLVSLAGGGNDVLRPVFDAPALARQFEQVLQTLRESGADVVVFRWARMTNRLPGNRMIVLRMQTLNRTVDEAAARHGAIVVDLWQDEEFSNPHLWSADRLHLAPAGHRRVAAHVLTALGVPPEASWFDPPRPAARTSWSAALAQDAWWAGRHLAPWLTRRLTGRSSGDAVSAKRPWLAPVAPSSVALAPVADSPGGPAD